MMNIQAETCSYAKILRCQCHAIWWRKYRSITRTSVLINTVYKCYEFHRWSV